MSKIKVIDLFNMISKGEEMPKKIKWRGVIFDYIKEESYEDYINCNHCSLFEHLGDKNEIYKVTNMLNDEVEIIEEKKIPEKLGEIAFVDGEIACCWSKSEAKLKTKINEIIDCLQYFKSKGDE